MSVNIKTVVAQAANKVGVAEEAANLISTHLVEAGYEMSKPTKNPPSQEEIEAAEAAQKRQSGENPQGEPTPAPNAQLRTGGTK